MGNTCAGPSSSKGPRCTGSLRDRRSRMSLPAECKGRSREGGMVRQFKGVENFLKRIAFNLGNTPSQTEVKIISCIPIDVSDLQHKILALEKQLDAKYFDPTPNQLVCQCPQMPKQHRGRAEYPSRMFGEPDEEPQCTSKFCRNSRKSCNVSFEKPSLADFGFEPHTRKCPCEAHFVEVKPYDKTIQTLLSPDTKHKKKSKINFRKKKYFQNKYKKHKSHSVYYVQTNNTSPFSRPKVPQDESKKSKVAMRSYLSEMINKQYKSRPLGGNASQISLFSSPVCRDTTNENMTYNVDSDACSCCCRYYQNIDNEIVKLNKQYQAKKNVTDSYYDSNLYDVIPVKEKPVKVKKPLDAQKKREPKSPIDIMEYGAENARANSVQCDFYTINSTPENCLGTSFKSNRREPTVKNNRKRKIDKHTKPEKDIRDLSMKSKTIIPRVINNQFTADFTRSKNKTDAECLTKFINNNECQTVITEESPVENIEETLNQIKSILQSVLHEVKVTTFKKGGGDEKAKKDPVVHKQVSQTVIQNRIPAKLPANMQESFHDDSFFDKMQDSCGRGAPNNLKNNWPIKIKAKMPNVLQANKGFDYLDNPYMPSCSKKINYDQSCCPPCTYLQSFPVFLQPPARHLCTCCFQRYSLPTRGYAKTATTTATNTDTVTAERSKETEQLIKEIYMTMAPSIGAVHVDSSPFNEHKPICEFTKTKNEYNKLPPVREPKVKTSVQKVISELFRTKDFTAVTPNTTDSNLRFENITSSEHLASGTGIVKCRNEKAEKFLGKSGRCRKNRYDKQQLRLQEVSDLDNHSKVMSNNSTAYGIVIIPSQPQQKEKKEKKPETFINKMFNSVKLFKCKHNKKRDNDKLDTQVISGSSSESDVYTTNSRKIRTLPHTSKTQYIPRIRSKIYTQMSQTDKSSDNLIRNSPYMEQEYRRQWNEKLMFGCNKCSDISNPFSGEGNPKSVFNRTFDTKTTIVEPSNNIERINTNVVLERQEKGQNTKNESMDTSNGISFFKKRKTVPRCSA